MFKINKHNKKAENDTPINKTLDKEQNDEIISEKAINKTPVEKNKSIGEIDSEEFHEVNDTFECQEKEEAPFEDELIFFDEDEAHPDIFNARRAKLFVGDNQSNEHLNSNENDSENINISEPTEINQNNETPETIGQNETVEREQDEQEKLLCGKKNEQEDIEKTTHETELVKDSEEFKDVDERNPIEDDKNASQLEQKPTRKNNFELKRKVSKIINNVVSTIMWTIGFALLFLCFSNLYQMMFNAENHTGFFGIGNAIVVSNSMEPNIYVNDVVFYYNTDIATIQKDDVIVYKSQRDYDSEEKLIVHRVVELKDGYVITQGDNNATPDEAFPIDNIVGKYMFKIPKIGLLLNSMSTKWAPLIAIAIILFITAIRIGYYIIHKKHIISQISPDGQTRIALDHFFDF